MLRILEQFGTDNYASGIHIVQNFYEFCQFFLYDSLGRICFDTPKSYTTYNYHLYTFRNIFYLQIYSGFDPEK